MIECKIKDVEIRVASAGDVENFVGRKPVYSVIAWIASYKGIDVCLAGIVCDGTRNIPFCDVKKNDASKITVWRTVQALFRLIKGLNVPMETGTEGRKSKFLEHLGFVQVGNVEGWEMYRFDATGGINA